MRIISGKYKAAKLLGYDVDGTRPTSDMVKESLFAMIYDYLKDSVCLDLFAGSGALGLEALSNGAAKCTFVDNNKEVLKVLEKNINKIAINSQTEIINSDYLAALNKFADKKIKFDIIFLDPPYDLNLIDKALTIIMEKEILNDTGIVVCEFANETLLDSYENLFLWKSKKYGFKYVNIYKYQK